MSRQEEKKNNDSKFSWMPKPLGERIAVIIALSIFALAILFVLFIIVFVAFVGIISASRTTGESKEIRYYPAGKRASNWFPT